MIIPQIATLHLTATLKMTMTIPEAPTTGPTIETPHKSAQELQAFNVRRGIELISEGQMGRGPKALLSKGISDVANNETINEQMKSKFHTRRMVVPSPTETQWNEERASIARKILRTTIMQLKNQVSPGLSGFRYEHLQAILFSEHSKADRLAKSAFDELHSLPDNIAHGRLPWYFYQIWNGSSLTALNKKDTADLEINEIMDCRPICKSEAIKKVITKILYKPFMNIIKAGCEPSQFSVGTNGGGSQLTMAITLLLEADPGLGHNRARHLECIQ